MTTEHIESINERAAFLSASLRDLSAAIKRDGRIGDLSDRSERLRAIRFVSRAAAFMLDELTRLIPLVQHCPPDEHPSGPGIDDQIDQHHETHDVSPQHALVEAFVSALPEDGEATANEARITLTGRELVNPVGDGQALYEALSAAIANPHCGLRDIVLGASDASVNLQDGQASINLTDGTVSATVDAAAARAFLAIEAPEFEDE